MYNSIYSNIARNLSDLILKVIERAIKGIDYYEMHEKL